MTDEEKVEMTVDKAGQEIVRGDFVVYVFTRCGKGELRFGIVTNIILSDEHGTREKKEVLVTITGIVDDCFKLNYSSGMWLFSSSDFLRVSASLVPDKQREMLYTVAI